MSKQQQCGTIYRYAHLVGMPFGIHSIMCGPVWLSAAAAVITACRLREWCSRHRLRPALWAAHALRTRLWWGPWGGMIRDVQTLREYSPLEAAAAAAAACPNEHQAP